MGCKNCKKKNLEPPVKTQWGVLVAFIFVIIFFVYGLVSFYFDILSFFS